MRRAGPTARRFSHDLLEPRLTAATHLASIPLRTYPGGTADVETQVGCAVRSLLPWIVLCSHRTQSVGPDLHHDRRTGRDRNRCQRHQHRQDDAGFSLDASGIATGFTRTASGTIQKLRVPGASDTRAYGINDKNQVVGWYISSTDGLTHGFLFNQGKYNKIDPPGSQTTNVWTISNDGTIIVGTYVRSDRHLPRLHPSGWHLHHLRCPQLDFD